MTDGADKSITIAMSGLSPVQITFTSTPVSGTASYTTDHGRSGTIPISSVSNAVTFDRVVPGDVMLITYSASGYLSQTQSIVASGTPSSINIVFIPAVQNVKVSQDPNSPSSQIGIEYVNPGYAYSYTVTSIGVISAAGYTIANAPTGRDVVFYFYANSMWNYAGRTAIVPDLATTPYILDFMRLDSRITITFSSINPVLDSTHYIKITARQCIDPGCSIYQTVSSNVTNLIKHIYVQLNRGDNLTLQMQYYSTITGLISDTTLNYGTVTESISLIIGQNIFLDLPTQVSINSVPPGASVYYMDDPYQPRLGITPFTTTAGWGEKTTLQFVLTNYVTQIVTPTWAPGMTNLTVAMVPQSWTIPITSTPSGASVSETVGGVVNYLGITPTTVIASYGDVISLGYSLTGYETLTQASILIDGPSSISNVNLLAKPTTFQFSLASVPTGASISSQNTNGTWASQGTTPATLVMPISYLNQTMTWKLVKSGYIDDVFTITFGNGVVNNTITRTLSVVFSKPRISTIALDKSSYTKPSSGTVMGTATITVYNQNSVSSVAQDVWIMVSGAHITTISIPAMSALTTQTFSTSVDLTSAPIGTFSTCAQYSDGTNGSGGTTCTPATMIATPTTFSFTITSVPTGAAVIYYDGSTWQYASGTTPIVITRPWSYMGTTEYWGITKNGYTTAQITMVYDNNTPGSTVTRTLSLVGTANLQIQTVTLDKTSYTKPITGTVLGTETVTVINTGSVATVAKDVWLMVAGTHISTIPVAPLAAGATRVYPISVDLTSVPIGSFNVCAQFADGSNSVCSTTATMIAEIPTSFSFTIASVPAGAAVAYYDGTIWQYASGPTPVVITRPWSYMGTTEYWFLQKTGYNTYPITLVYDSNTPGSTITKTLVATAASISLGTTTVTPTSVTSFPTTVTFTSNLTNTGSTQGSVTVYMYIGGTKIPTGQTYTVAGNGTTPVSMQYTFTSGAPAGSYTMCLDTA